MAKQQRSGVVAGARRVSDVQGKFQNLGEKFFTGYEKGLESKKKREEGNKVIQERANKLMDGFTNDIDVLKFKPEDQTLVKNKVVGWRNEYAEAANAASKLENKTGPEYQAYMDAMNSIKTRMSNLSNNINNLAATKGEYGKNIQARHYSSAGSNDIALHQGLIMTEFPIGSIDDTGNLMWSDEEAGDFNMQNYQLPFEKATGVATSLDNIASPLVGQKGPLTDFQRGRITEQVEELVSSDPNVLQSLISDGDLKQFGFEDIDPEDPNARDIVVSRLTQAMFDTKGSDVSGSKKSSKGGAQITYPQRLKAAEKKEVIAQIQGGYDKPIATGRRLKNGQELFLTLNTRVGKWILTDAAGTAVAGAGGNMVTFDTEEEAIAYLK